MPDPSDRREKLKRRYCLKYRDRPALLNDQSDMIEEKQRMFPSDGAEKQNT